MIGTVHQPCRQVRAALALAAVLAALGAAGFVGASAPASAQSPAPAASSCVGLSKVSTSSRLALVGSRAGVATSILALCAGEVFPLHVVLVLDGSRSMAGEPTETVKRIAHEVVDRLELPDHPQSTVAVVEINEPSKRLCGPTHSAWELGRCIDRLAVDGGSDIAGAIRLGLQALEAGRGSAGDRFANKEVMLVLTDGGNSEGCATVASVAGQAKSQGILMVTGCVTAGCDSPCMRLAATSLRYFFPVDRLDEVTGMMETISRQFANVVIERVAVTETVGSAFDWIDGSAHPDPQAWHGPRIAWQLQRLPRDGVTLTIGLRPLAAGFDLPVLADVSGQLLDNLNRPGEIAFDVPRIDVLDARDGAAPQALTATVPISNRLAVSAPRATVGQPLKVRYHLQLPAGEAGRLNVAVVQLRAPDHMVVGATWRGGRRDGQADADGHGAQWLVVGTPADVLDLEADVTPTGPGDGGLGVVVYRWDVDGRKPAAPVVAAVSRPVDVREPATPGTSTPALPTPTPTPRTVRLFLPVALAEACLAGPPSDIVVVADATTSMAERLPGGGTKRAAAAEALAALTLGLRGGGTDRLALVTFARNGQARSLFIDGGDGQAVALAYLDTPLADGDAIEAGITVGAALLAGPDRRAEARGVLIVLTDGRVASGAAALAAADAAKSAGVILVTAGIGPETNRPLLTALASSPGHASFSEDGAALRRAFERLPERLKCARTAYWGGRTK